MQMIVYYNHFILLLNIILSTIYTRIQYENTPRSENEKEEEKDAKTF